MERFEVEYQEHSLTFRATAFHDPRIEGPKPAICIFPTWAGRDRFVEDQAKYLASLGYVGFAADLYGNGQVGNSNEECSKLMHPLVDNRDLLRQRVLAAFGAMKHLAIVDDSKMGALGFCFGGLCALDLARTGVAVLGVVSCHGLLLPLAGTKANIQSKILVLHGHDDPMVSTEDVVSFEKEMTDAHVDWQVHIFGKTMHAFTNPKAAEPEKGLKYNAVSSKRGYLIMKLFFEEIFKKAI